MAKLLQGRIRPRKMSELTTLSELGITRDQASQWQRLASIPNEEFERLLTRPGTKPNTNGFVVAAGLSRAKPSKQVRISIAKLKGAPERFVAVGFKPETLAIVFLWFGSEKELRTKLRRRKMTEETIEQHLKMARERLPV